MSLRELEKVASLCNGFGFHQIPKYISDSQEYNKNHWSREMELKQEESPTGSVPQLKPLKQNTKNWVA